MVTKAKEKKAAGTLRLRMVGSLIGCTDKQRASVRGLGLRRMHQVVERPDTPAVRGMVNAVPHLVEIVVER
jgi:large subunit ribosomal protein L30